MTITAVYEAKTEQYVKAMAYQLTQSGYPTTAISLESYTGTSKIKGLPTFFIEKHGKLSYPITGKLSYEEILTWIKQSGV